VAPPSVDVNGYGLRVPGLVISPYARRGVVDHQTLSFDAYDKFIEDVFLNGARIDPASDGRPDPRPDVRETASILGNLAADFDFTQQPRAPDLLPVHPATTLTGTP
jgi:phospholipase C